MYLTVDTDENGLCRETHIAAGPYVQTSAGEGELLLCGKVLVYSTHRGFAPDARPCLRCRQMDA